MNRTNIEFADFSFNPIVGCRNGCDYCWARKFNDRYFKNNDFSVPKFYPERFDKKIPGLPKKRNEIARIISPDKPVVFVVDMGDIFSPGVGYEWQRLIFEYGHLHPEINLLFLTKNPNGYLRHFIRRDNSFIGTSLDYAHNYRRIDYLKQLKSEGHKIFVNIEPLMSRMDAVDFSGIDFVIVGAMTGRKYRPDPAWHKSINHPVIYYKNNYLQYFPELKSRL